LVHEILFLPIRRPRQTCIFGRTHTQTRTQTRIRLHRHTDRLAFQADRHEFAGSAAHFRSYRRTVRPHQPFLGTRTSTFLIGAQVPSKFTGLVGITSFCLHPFFGKFCFCSHNSHKWSTILVHGKLFFTSASGRIGGF
jgi:hypothetical protein